MRFLAAGLGNSIITLGAYQALVSVVSPAAAYTIAWAFGILVVATLYPVAVYRVRADALSGGTMGMVYIGSFFLGLMLTQLLVYLGLYPRVIIIVVMFITSLASYVVGRIALNLITKSGTSQIVGKVRSVFRVWFGRWSAKG